VPPNSNNFTKIYKSKVVITQIMNLFAHFQPGTETNLDAMLRGLPGFQAINKHSIPMRGKGDGTIYWYRGNNIRIEVKPHETRTDLVTVILDMDLYSSPPNEELRLFQSQISALEQAGFVPVADHDLFSDPEDNHLSKYWGAIGTFIDSCQPRTPHWNDSLTGIIDKRTGEAVPLLVAPNENFHVGDTAGIEYLAIRSIDDPSALNQLYDEHFELLRSLARFIQYVEVSKRSTRNPDQKAAVHLDEIMKLGYDLLQRPQDHHAFTDFIGKVIELDDRDKESLYHTLAFIDSAVVLTRGELAKHDSDIPHILQDLQRYGRTSAIINRISKIGEHYPDIPRVQVGKIMERSYSEGGLLRELITIENTSPTPDLDRTVKRMLQFGNFDTYLRSSEGTLARAVLDAMETAGFNRDIFTSNQQSNDVLTREHTSLVNWERNFLNLIDEFRRDEYNLFFIQDEDEREVMNQELKKKVLSLAERISSTQHWPNNPQEGGSSYILNKVKGMLYHCRKLQAKKIEKGKRVDSPLITLEEKLESLEIQLEFGGRPTGGVIYSRQWHRVIEDFSMEETMLCCAALGGNKQDLTFAAIYNPTYTYLTYFIQGIDQQLGFSILQAGIMGGKKVLLSISPYEANPAIRTALGPAETHRYVLDSMVKAAHDANAEELLIDDIDLKVRDEERFPVRMENHNVKKMGDTGYETAEDIFVQYKNGEPCAPRGFRRFMEKTVRKYQSATHEDVRFEQIQGDDLLVEEQLGEGRRHYSIQSIPVLFDPAIDYQHFPNDKTKTIFDNGYHSLDCTRTVFRINVTQYIQERKMESVELVGQPDTIRGISRV